MKRNIKNSVISIMLALVMTVTYTPLVNISGAGHISDIALAEEVADPEVYLDGEAYKSMSDAISDAKDGSQIMLAKTVKGSFIIPEGKTIELDLAGQMLVAAGNVTPVITNNGVLTITDVMESGKVTGLISNTEKGTLYVKGGDFTAIKGKSGFSNSGSMTISGGTISSSGAMALEQLKGTLLIKGGSIDGITSSSGKITISGGEVKGLVGRSAIMLNDKSCELIVKGGSIDSSGNGGNAVTVKNACTMTVSAGTIKSDAYAIYVSDAASDLNVNIKDDAVVIGDITAVGKGSIKLTGGYFDRKYDDSLYGDGCAAVITTDRTDGTQYTISTGYFLVGEVGLYKNYSQALNAAGENSTIKLVKDYSGSIVVSKGKTTTLDLNGKTIDALGTEQNAIAVQNDGELTIIDETGTGKISGAIITYKNGTTTIKNGNFENGNASALANSGTLNIEAGNITGISNIAGKLFITDGTVISSTNAYVSDKSVVQRNAAVYNTSGGKAEMSGGALRGKNGVYLNKSSEFKLTGGVVAASGTAFVSDSSSIEISDTPSIVGGFNVSGGTVTLTGGYYSVKPNQSYYNNTDYTVVNSEAGAQGTQYQLKGYDKCIVDAFSYPSIEDALRVTSSGKTIKLIADIKENVTIPSGKNITIDLNGHSLSAKSGDVVITNNGTLTLKNQQSQGKYSGQVKNNPGADLTIESGTFDAGDNYAIDNEGTLKVNGGTITGILTTNGTVNAKGGKITSTTEVVPVTAKNSNTQVVIEGSVLDGSFAKYALRLESAANAKITAGTLAGGTSGAIGLISGKASVVISDNAIIKGGITKNSEGTISALGGWYSSPVDKSWLVTGAVPSTKIASGPSGAQYTILSTFTIDLNFPGNTKVYKYEISSGTVMKAPDEPVRQGYRFTGWYSDKNGRDAFDFSQSIKEPTTIYAGWTDSDPWQDNCTGECTHEIKVGNRHFDTFADAVEYADDKATLVVLRDFTAAVTIPSSKTFTLDLNGHVVSQYSEKKAVIINKGNLTVKDSSGTKSGKITIPNQSGNADTIENQGTLSIESGTVYNGNAYACAILNAGGTLNIKGGTIKSALSYAVYNRESDTTYGVVNVTDGLVEAMLYGIWTTGNGKTSVSGGIVHSLKSYAVMNGVDETDTKALAGVTEITGGTVKSDAGDSDAAAIYNYCGSVTILQNEKDKNYPQLIGTSPIVNSTKLHQNVIKGGWFSSMLIADSFTRVINDDGTKLTPTAAISSGPANAKYTIGYKITYNMNYSGGTNVVTYAPVTTGKFNYIDDPERSNAVFEGWYLDKNGTSQANISKMVVTEDTTIYAKWRTGSTATQSSKQIFVNGKYILTLKTPTNGKLDAQILSGDTVKVTLTPDDGYQVASVFMDGNYAGDGYKSYKVTLKNDTTIAATFLPKSLTADEYREEIEKQKKEYNEETASYSTVGGDTSSSRTKGNTISEEKSPTKPSNGDDSTSGSQNNGGEDSSESGSDSSGNGSGTVKNKNGDDYTPGKNYSNNDKNYNYNSGTSGGGTDSQGWSYTGKNIDDYIPDEESLTHLTIDRTQTTEDQVKQAKEILALFDLTARSGYATSPKGKKAIKIIWYDKKYSMDVFDGVEIYRSTKRFKGYGKNPKFETILGRYYNTTIKKGTRYYYKMRGYIEIDGTRYYTDWSLKAIRKAK